MPAFAFEVSWQGGGFNFYLQVDLWAFVVVALVWLLSHSLPPLNFETGYPWSPTYRIGACINGCFAAENLDLLTYFKVFVR